jgi:hypothetical protein
MAGRKKDDTEPDWKGSKAKRLLISELVKGTIPLKNEEMSSRDVYMSYVEFTEFSFDKFQRNLGSLRKKIREKKRMAHEENAALKHDLDLYPPKERDVRGVPRWAGSAAKEALAVDIDNERHKQMKPKELWSSHSVYKDNYLNKVLRKHIPQEVRCQK